MRVVVQRVASARVEVDGLITAVIGSGLLVLVGFEANDADADLAWMSAKLARLRIFSDPTGRMNHSLIETHEVRRVALEEEVTRRSQIEAEAEKVRGLTEAQVTRILRALAEDVETIDRDRLKDFVRGLLEKVEIDLDASTFRISYRLSAGDRVASPRGFEPRYLP
ncbi:D-aminoacyl-tRNA deacylase [Accumulibacter sp.]|uniref:D-aminoacyl-tRNA deacylase n=1 Tax=Accumulibacter sp. TaxID=2053492 RepID=UPI00260EE81D|nr:D-aminoacyl-tRNA deacylase [Accumulibacter sp.]